MSTIPTTSHSTVTAPGTVTSRDVTNTNEPTKMEKFTEGLATIGVKIGEGVLGAASKVAGSLRKSGIGGGPAVRIAIVGCGEIARTHIEALMKTEKAFVTALCDPMPDNRETMLSLIRTRTSWEVPPQFPNLESALGFDDTNSLFDAVMILAPSECHEDLAIRACLAKKHVFIETPIALTAEAAQRILKVASDSGVVCFVGEQSQFWHEVLLAKAVIDSGEMGRVLTVRARMTKSKLDYVPGHALAGASSKLDALRAGGGFMFDSGVHWIRPIRIWMGNVDAVLAWGGHSVKDIPFSMGHAILRMTDGSYASFEALLTETPISRQPWFDIQCERGEIVIDSAFDGGYGVKVFSLDHPQGVLASEGPQGWTTAFQNEVADFIDRLFPISVADVSHAEMATNDLQTMLAMKQSMETGDWVKVFRVTETTPVTSCPDTITHKDVLPTPAYPVAAGSTFDTSRIRYSHKAEDVALTNASSVGGAGSQPLPPPVLQQQQPPTAAAAAAAAKTMPTWGTSQVTTANVPASHTNLP